MNKEQKYLKSTKLNENYSHFWSNKNSTKTKTEKQELENKNKQALVIKSMQLFSTKPNKKINISKIKLMLSAQLYILLQLMDKTFRNR